MNYTEGVGDKSTSTNQTLNLNPNSKTEFFNIQTTIKNNKR